MYYRDSYFRYADAGFVNAYARFCDESRLSLSRAVFHELSAWPCEHDYNKYQAYLMGVSQHDRLVFREIDTALDIPERDAGAHQFIAFSLCVRYPAEYLHGRTTRKCSVLADAASVVLGHSALVLRTSSLADCS